MGHWKFPRKIIDMIRTDNYADKADSSISTCANVNNGDIIAVLELWHENGTK